jgi:predicted lipid-binding transport protein (Tim44 family)
MTKLQRLEQKMLDAKLDLGDAQMAYQEAQQEYHEEEQRLLRKKSRRKQCPKT